MVREIKFRIYDGNNSFYQYPELLELNIGLEYEQYTGLKDSTKWESLTPEAKAKWIEEGNSPEEWQGVEIYEGDIVTGDGYKKGIVKYGLHSIGCCGCCFSNHQSVGFYIDQEGRPNPYAEENTWEDETLEVIGNIHEHPWLLGGG